MTKVVFLGYGAIGVHCLERCLEAGVEVSTVLTRQSDRVLSDADSSVYTFAHSCDITASQHRTANSAGFIDLVRRQAPDYLISVQYDRILKPEIIGVPSLGCLNLHFAPLPRLRGCFPTKWAIINGESSGVTLHYIDPGIDTGPIIDQVEVGLAIDETDQSLYSQVVEAGKALFDKHVEAIANQTVTAGISQPELGSSYYPKQTPHNGVIDWNWDAARVERFIRAFTFPPYPGAKAAHAKGEVEFRAPVKVLNAPAGKPGMISSGPNNSVIIACGDVGICPQNVLIDGIEHPATVLLDLIVDACFVEGEIG